ncbi:hypothetical protein RDI58_016360 [Solanum bulbocastanum]|uniref:Uncharacterized protein n=1 Tax=Solanum bulbocastanum TaxID=147425 RepID=A0AAN8THB4_SOLBU
MYLSPISYS